MQEKNARIEAKTEGTVENGNIAVIDFKGYVDGEAFQGGEGKDYSLEIGSKTFIDTFEEQLVGAKVNDTVEVNVTFPENYGKEELNGKPAKFEVTIKEIIEFHYRFERIHPFQDGNGRIGRIILFKECLKNNIVPFIIQDADKLFYYRGLKEYKSEKGYLIDTCLNAQDQYVKLIEYYLK